MGSLTRTQIISQGLARGGNTDIEDEAVVHLNAVLRSLYTGFDWPFLKRRKEDVALAADATSLSIGAGSSGVTLQIRRIYDPILIRNSDLTVARRVARLVENYENDDPWGYQTTRRGIPDMFKCEDDPSVDGRKILRPNIIPDRALLLLINYHEIPADLSSDSTTPRYPNDQTLIQAVMAFALGWDDPESAAAANALSLYEAMAANDRVKYGQDVGQQVLGLDPKVFR